MNRRRPAMCRWPCSDGVDGRYTSVFLSLCLSLSLAPMFWPAMASPVGNTGRLSRPPSKFFSLSHRSFFSIRLSLTDSPKNGDPSTFVQHDADSPEFLTQNPVWSPYFRLCSSSDRSPSPPSSRAACLHRRLGFAIHGYFPVVSDFDVILQRLIEEYSSRVAWLSCRSLATEIVPPDAVVGIPAPRWYELN